MKAWKYVAAGGVLQKLPMFAAGLCCLLFMSAGPARAQSATDIDALQAQINALQKQVDALRLLRQRSQRSPRPLPWRPTHRPRPLQRRVPG